MSARATSFRETSCRRSCTPFAVAKRTSFFVLIAGGAVRRDESEEANEIGEVSGVTGEVVYWYGLVVRALEGGCVEAITVDGAGNAAVRDMDTDNGRRAERAW